MDSERPPGDGSPPAPGQAPGRPSYQVPPAGRYPMGQPGRRPPYGPAPGYGRHAYAGARPGEPPHGPAPGAPWGHPTYRARFVRHTGLLVLWYQSSAAYEGSFGVLTQHYRAAQRHCLLFGWWSLWSVFFFNWLALGLNWYRYHRVRQAVAASRQAALSRPQGPRPPGWP